MPKQIVAKIKIKYNIFLLFLHIDPIFVRILGAIQQLLISYIYLHYCAWTHAKYISKIHAKPILSSFRLKNSDFSKRFVRNKRGFIKMRISFAKEKKIHLKGTYGMC